MPEKEHKFAYMDGPRPIGHGQTISQPYIVALMSALPGFAGEEKVLEIGTGSGYQAAILSRLVSRVVSVERIPELAASAESALTTLDLTNVEVRVADGTLGCLDYAPYDAILVTAAAPKVPEPLKDQLKDQGCLVVPVGTRAGQVLECWRRSGGDLVCEQVAPVAFVPLLGEHGWDEKDSGWSWWR